MAQTALGRGRHAANGGAKVEKTEETPA